MDEIVMQYADHERQLYQTMENGRMIRGQDRNFGKGLEGYYLGLHGNPFDEYHPINEWEDFE